MPLMSLKFGNTVPTNMDKLFFFGWTIMAEIYRKKY